MRNHGMQPNGDGSNKPRERTRTRKAPPRELCLGRNLKIPDRLYDPLSRLARKTKLTKSRILKIKRVGEGEAERGVIHRIDGYRYQTISEAVCLAIADYLTKNGEPFDKPKEESTEEE